MSNQTSPDSIALRHDPLDIAAALASVSDDRAGGIAIFLGTTRSEINSAHRPLLALDYEAYGEMALRQMNDLVIEARKRWPIQRAVLHHRIGRVDVGQPSVLVAISAPHRAQAFEACRFLIDALKAQATIWKKEVWMDGTESWVHPE